jgi:hypothetical protein
MGHRDLTTEHVAVKGNGLRHIVRDDRNVVEHPEGRAETIAIGQR